MNSTRSARTAFFLAGIAVLAACSAKSERALDQAPAAQSPPDAEVGALQGRGDRPRPDLDPARGPYAEPATSVYDIPDGWDLVVEGGKWRLGRDRSGGAPGLVRTDSRPPAETWLEAVAGSGGASSPRTVRRIHQSPGLHVFLGAPRTLAAGKPEHLTLAIFNFRPQPSHVSIDIDAAPGSIAIDRAGIEIRANAGSVRILSIRATAARPGAVRIRFLIREDGTAAPDWQTAVLEIGTSS